MAHPILMPKPGQMTEECTLVAWLKKPGDPVRRGDVLFEIETDKSNMDVEAFDEGVLLRTYVEVGQTVPVNSVVAYVGAAGEDTPAEPPAAASATTTLEGPPSTTPAQSPHPISPATADGVAVAVAPSPATAAPAVVVPIAAGLGDRIKISPRASRLAASSGIDPRTLTGTGPDGRISERDVLAAIEGRRASDAIAPAEVAQVQPPVAPVQPAAARPVQSAAPAPRFEHTPTTGAEEEESPRPLSRMRQVIAERLTISATTVPQFTVTMSVDMTRLLGFRSELKAAGTQLSVTDFVLAATAQTLVEFPDVNSRTDGKSVWPRRRVHLGLAVSLPNGLVVPVIRDAHKLSLTEIHDRAATLAASAREGKLSPDELTGSTFTISNLGMFGVDEFTAILNPGESAILAVSSVMPAAIAVGDGIAVRQVMKLTISADHRLIDGELAARFLNALRRRLTDVDAFRIDAVNS